MTQDVAIIGAGPAGYSAAIYTARAGLSTLLFGRAESGNLYKAHLVGNYFGAADNPSGADLLTAAERQLLSLQGTHLPDEIVSLASRPDGTFELLDGSAGTHSVRAVIIATGQAFLLAGIAGEKEFTGRGVSYCVTCDGFFFKNRPVAVIGNSDYAAAEALELLDYTRQVTILTHGKPPAFSAPLADRLEQSGVSVLATARLASFAGEEKLEKIVFAASLPDGRTEMAVDGAFMAVGKAGANAFAQKLGLELEGGNIRVDREGRTNLPGVFAAGDCTGSPAQVAVSVGSGCIAALATIKLLRGLSNYSQYN
jgi:thioredoxin reductase (NADPH)